MSAVISRLSKVIYLAAMVVSCLGTGAGQTATDSERKLKTGNTLEERIAAGETHRYRVSLRARQVLRVDVQEMIWNVRLELQTPDGRSIAKTDLGGGYDREQMIYAADADGDLILCVTPEKEYGKGRYSMTTRIDDTLDANETLRSKALALLEEANTLQREATAESFRAAIDKRGEALAIWRQIGDRYWEGRTLDRLAGAYLTLQQNNKAVESMEAALAIVRASGDKLLEAATLNSLGSMNNGFGEYEIAADYHSRALDIFRKEKNDLGVAVVTWFLGRVAQESASIGDKDFTRASGYYQQALDMVRSLGRRDFESSLIAAQSNVLTTRQYGVRQPDEKKKVQRDALEKIGQAIEISREIGRRDMLASQLLSKGGAQITLNDLDDALVTLAETMTLSKAEKLREVENSAHVYYSIVYGRFKKNDFDEQVKHSLAQLEYYKEFPRSLSVILANDSLGSAYSNRGKTEDAIKYFNAAADTPENVPERTSPKLRERLESQMRESKANTLFSLAGIATNKDNFKGAIEYYERAKAVFEKGTDDSSKSMLAFTHSAMSEQYRYLRDWDKALENANRSLVLSREIEDVRWISGILNKIALIHDSMGINQNLVLKNYLEALGALEAFKDRDDVTRTEEAAILGNIASTHEALGHPREALDFYERALKKAEEIKDVEMLTSARSAALASLAGMHRYVGDSKKALEMLQQSLDLFRAAPEHVRNYAKNRTFEGSIYNQMGNVYSDTGRLAQAMEMYQKALNANKDREASTGVPMLNISGVLMNFGRPDEALKHIENARGIFQKYKSDYGLMSVHNRVGLLYSYRSDHERSLNEYKEALAIANKTDAVTSRAVYLNNIGVQYGELGRIEEAFQYLHDAEKLAVDTGNKGLHATTLGNLAANWSGIGNRAMSLKMRREQLEISRQIGDKSGEADALGGLAADYLELGEYATALENRNEALRIHREIGERSSEAYDLIQIASIHRQIGEKSKDAKEFEAAEKNLREALDLSIETLNKRAETAATNGLGRLYVATGNAAKAVEWLGRALGSAVKYQLPYSEVTALSALGRAHELTNDWDKAVERYNAALERAARIQSRDDEPRILARLMTIWQKRDDKKRDQEKAIDYGMQAIGKFQMLKGKIGSATGLKSYNQKTSDIYRELVELLKNANRPADAQLVMTWMQETELNEYKSDGAVTAAERTGDGNPAEILVAKRQEYTEIARQYTELKDERSRYKAEHPGRPFPKEDEFAKLQAIKDAAAADWKTWGTKLSEPRLKKDLEMNIGDTLRQMKAKRTAVVSVFIGEKEVYIVVTTTDISVGHTVSISAAEVRETAEKFHKEISRRDRNGPTGDIAEIRRLGQQLYRWIVAPIEPDLAGIKADTIIWQLDGVLKYVPMAAIWDEKRGYVAERFASVMLTPKTISNIKDAAPDRSKLRIIGFAATEGTSKFGGLSPLKNAGEEVRCIVADPDEPHRTGDCGSGIIPGKRMVDDKFTRESFRDESGRFPPFVFMATHFVLDGKDPGRSFLLTGDMGDRQLFVDNIESDAFLNVDLLVLSACETGFGSPDASGIEFQNLADESQRRGAKSVIATLWLIADKSTPEFMKGFFNLYASPVGVNKAEAVRRSQVEMIKAGKYAHPNYWAPFVLVGNWQ
ncbi:MAG: tetratricopeptide repeat protein [Pyrinomonadaceae bacterium]